MILRKNATAHFEIFQDQTPQKGSFLSTLTDRPDSSKIPLRVGKVCHYVTRDREDGLEVDLERDAVCLCLSGDRLPHRDRLDTCEVNAEEFVWLRG